MGYTGVNLKRINAAHFRRLVEESYRDTVERTKGPKRKK
jgi:hypothetical protein